MEKLKPQSERQSNFELLRIIAMLMVILVHYAGHGGGRLVPLLDTGITYNLGFYFTGWFQKTQAMFLNIGGQIGVNVFVLVGGYFLSGTTFKTERLLKSLAQVFFYSITMAYILSAIGIVDISAVHIKNIFLPFLTNQYWFATSYILLYLVSPFLNIFIKNATQKQFLWLLAVLILMSSVVPSILNIDNISYMWFAVLYFAAAYIRKYDLPFLKKPLAALAAYAAVYLGIFAATIWRHLTYPGTVEAKDFIADKMTNSYRIWIFAASVLLFLSFKNLKIKNSRIINALSGTTFGIYLIHDNTYLRLYLWNNIIKTYRYFYNNYYIFYALLTALVIFLACSAIDFLRLYLLEKPLFWCYRRIVKEIKDKNVPL